MALTVSILGAGFIGMNLLYSCVGAEYAVRVLDRNPCPPGLTSQVDWIEGSFLNINDVRSAVHGADVVFHLISSTVPGDMVDVNEELLSDVANTTNLLKVCVQEKVKKVVFISSSSVYGTQERLPISETAVTDPISSHGIQKLTIEKYLQLFRYEHGLACKIMRLSNPYGIGQDVHKRQGFIAIAIGSILDGKPLAMRGRGNAIRDFLYIDDVIQACHLLMCTDTKETVFNVGSGKGVCLRDVVAEIEGIIGRKVLTNYVEERRADIPASILDISKARNVIGYEPSISLHEGLTRMLSFHGII